MICLLVLVGQLDVGRFAPRPFFISLWTRGMLVKEEASWRCAEEIRLQGVMPSQIAGDLDGAAIMALLTMGSPRSAGPRPSQNTTPRIREVVCISTMRSPTSWIVGPRPLSSLYKHVRPTPVTVGASSKR